MLFERKGRLRLSVARIHMLLLAIFSLLHLVPYAIGRGLPVPLPPFLPMLPIVLQGKPFGGVVPLVGMASGLITGLLYFLCWRMSRRHPIWMLAALALFVMDTGVMLLFAWEWSWSGLLHMALHGWVLCWLLLGSLVILGEELARRRPPACGLGAEEDGRESG